MDGLLSLDSPLGIAAGAVLVVGICVQLAVALRNRYRHVKADDVEDVLEVEKDLERFDEQLELQLQSELEEAIKASSTSQEALIDVSTASSPIQVRFDETANESSWTTFKRESKAKIEHLAKSLNLLSDDESKLELDSAQITPPGLDHPQMTQLQQQHSPRRQLPLLDSEGALAERNVLVNAKQYSRILKRRYARQLIEDYFRSPPKAHSPRIVKTSMRRPRGPGGRFLTADEPRQIETGEMMLGMAE